MRHEYRKAVMELTAMQKNKNMAMPRSSTSCTPGHYNLGEILSSVRIWSLRLRAWVYGKQTDQPIPPAYAIPRRFTTSTHRLPHRNVWRDRGAPTPCESSTEEESDEDEEENDDEEGYSDSERQDFTSEDDFGF